MKFDFSLEQANIILQALGKMPYEAVFQIVSDFQRQAEEQIKANHEQPVKAVVEG